jgi:hypothetical protein
VGKVASMKCTFENCEKEAKATSFCQKHYCFVYCRKKRGIPLDWPKGKVYNKRKRKRRKKKKVRICIVDGCVGKHVSKGYCSFHYERIKKGIPLNRPKGMKGELNHNWKGGVSDYPNQRQMRKNRKLKIEQEKGKCEVCKHEARIVHHLDGIKSNHEIDNLKLLCDKCHKQFHPRHKKTSIWIRRYGMLSKDLCKRLQCSYGTLVKWHKSSDIKYFLEKKLK